MSARRNRRSGRASLRLQALEGRIAPAIFAVSNTNDSGSGSLRQAVLDANAAAGADVISFTDHFNVPRDIFLNSWINISDPVTIAGTSATNVNIRGDNFIGTILTTNGAPSGSAIGLENLTFSGGGGWGVGGWTYGGGAIIVGNVSLNVAHCRFIGNSANNGGAVFVAAGTLSATDCTFTSNYAWNGGAIYAAAGTHVELTRCEISSNQAHIGGGLCTEGTLNLIASTVSGNLAYYFDDGYGWWEPGIGGGISASGPTTIRNSTISGNAAVAWGGAVGWGAGISAGNVVVQNSTITRNEGGGIVAGQIFLESSIVANNAPDIQSNSVTAKNSLIFNRNGIGTFHDLGGNRPEGEDPKLAPLANHGGPTKTHVLRPGSPCLDTGSNPANLTTDQRGPGFPRVLNGATDMGAVEGADVPWVTPVRFLANITSLGVTSYDIVVRYMDDLGIDLATIDLNDITVVGPGYAVPQSPTSFSITSSGTVVTVAYTAPAPAGGFDFLDNGLYTVAVVANQVGDVDTPVQHFVAAGTLGTFRVSIPVVVDEPSDIDDGDFSAGHLSLREALRLTNAAVGTADTITFDTTVFASPRTIVLAAGLFTISNSVVIVGPGSGLLTLNAAGASQHFRVDTFGTALSLSGMTLINGRSFGYGGAIGGGTGSMLLSDIIIDNCWSEYGGGAISTSGSLTMRDCTVRNNVAAGTGYGFAFGGGGGGGGLMIASSPSVVPHVAVLLERCSLVNNQSASSGGGLFIWGDGGLQVSISISECTISGNHAAKGGGGARIFGSLSSGSFIRNSTISGNVAANTAPGGGLNLILYGTLLDIANSTITGNSTNGNGGGIHSFYGTYIGNVRLNSTIIAGNAASTGADLYLGNSTATAVPGNNNLIGVANSGNFVLTGSGNLTGTLAAPLNPMLAPLGNNGGPTKTHALLSGSPAIDTGNNAAGLTTDQRGPGYLRVVGTAADIGAFEIQTTAPTVASTVIGNGAVQRSRVADLTLTFSAQITFTGQVADAFTLVRDGGKPVQFAATATLVDGVTVVTLSNFTGVSAEFGSLADGRYTLTAIAAQISANGQSMANDYIFGDAQGLYRFFGDANGDRRVDGLDFGVFVTTYGLLPTQTGFLSYLDFNGDGRVDGLDFGQIVVRYNTNLP